LESPIYWSKNATCHVSPNQQIDTGDTLKASLKVGFMQEKFKGALLYKLRRKHTTRANNQPNDSTASIENTATNMCLLVAWDVNKHHRMFRVCLIEPTDNSALDEDKLWALYYAYNSKFHQNYLSNTITWLMNDDTVIETKLDVTYGSNYKLAIIISEGIKSYKMERSMKIDPKRLVLSLSMLIVLMYAVSLSNHVLVNIHNQCLNIDLVPPIYITGYGLECHRAPDYKVSAGDTMRSNFIISKLDYEPYGVLMYKLQRKQTHKSIEFGKDISSATYLLVVWEFSRFNELYADVLLVEHDKGFDKDALKHLYKNDKKYILHSSLVIETWLLNDNAALIATSETMNEGHLLNITISQVERYNYVRTPAYIDPGR
jgi:hypothetical protein